LLDPGKQESYLPTQSQRWQGSKLESCEVMEHTPRVGISTMCANSSVDMFDFNGHALMEAAPAHVGDHNGLLFCTDLIQGNSGTGSLNPVSPYSSSPCPAVDLKGWNFATSDSLWASHDLPVKPDENFQAQLYEASELLTRNESENLISFTQDHPSFHPLGGLDIPGETILFGGWTPQGRVDKKETNCGYSSDELDDFKEEDENGSPDGRFLQPETLLLERRRRGQLNERLYTLRSLVPKITKVLILLNSYSYDNLFESQKRSTLQL